MSKRWVPHLTQTSSELPRYPSYVTIVRRVLGTQFIKWQRHVSTLTPNGFLRKYFAH